MATDKIEHLPPGALRPRPKNARTRDMVERDIEHAEKILAIIENKIQE